MLRTLLLPLALAAVVGARAVAQATFVLPGDTTPAVSAGDQLLPALARGGAGWLAVWEDDRAARGGFVQAPDGFHPNRDVYAARLDANGTPMDVAPIVVSAAPFDQVEPRAAWNGSHWLVVWTSSRATQFHATRGIYAARVAADGTVLDVPPILIEDGDDFDERGPNVSSDGVNWLVVWNDYVPGQPAETLDGALVSATGVVFQKQTILGGAQPTYPTNVDLEFAVDRWLIAYEKSWSGAYGRLVGTDLAPIGAEIAFQPSAHEPEVASNGFDFFVSWSGARGTPVSRAGVAAIPGGTSYLGAGSAYGPETDCAWNGSEWVVAFGALGAGGNDTLHLSHVTSTGQLAPGSPTTVASTTNLRSFAAASGSDRAQLVWNDWSVSAATWAGPDVGDVFGAQVMANGGVGARAPVSVSASAQIQPAVAGSASAGWLVGFLRRTSGVTQVCAQRLTGLGAPVDAQPIVLATGNGRIQRMDVAFDGARWLVVWDDTTAAGLRHTFGMRVALDGALLDGVPVDYLRGERPQAAATEHGRFLVVAWDHNQSNEYVRAMRVEGADGAKLDAPYLTLGSGSGFPDVLGFDDRWVVAWGGVRGAFVFEDGTLGAPFYFAQGASETVHGLARSGDLGLLAFVAGPAGANAVGDVHVRRFRKDGTLLDTDVGIALCTGDRRQLDPRAAFDGASFRVTWTDYRAHGPLEPGLGDVYQAVVGTDGSVQTPCGVPVAADASRPEGDAEIAADGGVVIVAAAALRPEAPLGGLRVEVRTSAGSIGSTPFCAGDGSGAACPCGNASAPGANEGCASSLGVGATLRGTGWTSLAADSLVLAGERMPNSSALYFQGTQAQNGGAGVAFGDGLRCIGGTLVRLGTKSNVAGASQYPAPGDPSVSIRGGVVAPGTRRYQVWYRNAAAFCTTSTFNLTNGVSVVWF